MHNVISYDRLIEKWGPVLNEESAGTIQDKHRRAVTAAVLENQENALREEGMMFENAAAPANSTAGTANWNPVLIALVRRAMPNLMAYDLCGVQPMTGPTGLIFAMKSRYGGGSTSNREALFNEAETKFSGDSAGTHDSDNASGLNGITDSNGDSSIDNDRLTALAAGGMPTADAEALGPRLFLREPERHEHLLSERPRVPGVPRLAAAPREEGLGRRSSTHPFPHRRRRYAACAEDRHHGVVGA